MPAIGIDLLTRKLDDEASRKAFVTNLDFCYGQSEKHGGQTLCQRCSGIFSNSGEETLKAWQLEIGTLKEISDSAEGGCLLCILLRETISPLSTTQSCQIEKYVLSFDWEKTWITIEQYINAYKRRDRFSQHNIHAKLELFVDKEDPASSFIKGRPDIQDFTSSKTLEIIQHWLNECKTSKYHETCRVSLAKTMPSRLVDVGKEGDPRVRLSQTHKAADYIALSYCWGGPQDLVLTAENTKRALFAFEFCALPLALQGAITMTRKLGVRYLWVDALCIIQDGDGGKDFTLQGPKMDDIYGSSLLTIAVASTNNVRECFLNTCKTHGGKSPAITLPYRSASDQVGNITISARNRIKEYETEPLLSRAWTLQERVLSQRVVSFHKDHLTWNCRNSHESSDGTFWPNTDLSYLLPSIIPREFFAPTSKPTTKIPMFWRLCVEDYSNRLMSVETDKLTALAGVARRIHERTGDEYLAGLWRSDIMMQLCWSTVKESNRGVAPPSCYLAPSWSWASLNSKVKFFQTYANEGDWRTHVLDAKIKPLNKSSPFSRVTNGQLSVRGPLKRVSTADECGNLLPASLLDKMVSRVIDSKTKISAQSSMSEIMDAGRQTDENQSCELYWLWMFSNQSKTFLLLLKSTDKKAVFTRLGSIELEIDEMEFKWFRDAEVQTLKLI